MIGEDGEPCPQVLAGPVCSSSTPRRRRSTPWRARRCASTPPVFSRLDEAAAWNLDIGRGRRYVVRDGALVAWAIPDDPVDAPSASSAPTPTRRTSGSSPPRHRLVPGPPARRGALRGRAAQLLAGARPRDLGRLAAARGTLELRLVRIDEPVLRVPQLAIHLAEDRTAGSLIRSGTSSRSGASAADAVGFRATSPSSRRARRPTFSAST